MDIEKIGQFIKELRKEKNISQNELSEEIHVTRQAISAWENGKAVPDSDVLLMLSSYFNVSINEILLGKRLTSDEGLENLTLQLIDDHNKKIRKIKKLIISLSTTIILSLVIFLGYYFLNNYNSIKVYKVSGYKEVFKTNNGIFVTTKNKVYLRLGKITQQNLEEDKDINKVKLYYKYKNKEYILFEENKTDILIDEEYGYKEFFLNNDMNKAINNMYLEITYNETEKEIIKISFKETFKNTFSFLNKKENVKALKDKINLNDFRKKEALINELTQAAKEKVKEQLEVRQKLDSGVSLKENKNIDEKEDYYENNYQYTEETNYQEPTQEVFIEEKPVIVEERKSEIVEEGKSEIVEEENTGNKNPLLTTNPTVEEEKDKIDYERIINIIKENGINQGGIYVYEFTKDDKMYSTYYEEDKITIYTMYENVIENIELYTDINKYYYHKYVDYNEDINENGNILENPDVFIRTNKIFE